MTQVFILGAAKPKHSLYSNTNESFLLQFLNEKTRILDWIINGLTDAGISSNQIYFVGGQEVDKIIKNYPDLNVVVNPRWSSTHVVGSLKYAMKDWMGGEVLTLFADTLYRTEVFRDVFSLETSIAAGVDFNWKARIKDVGLIESAEKVLIKDRLIYKAGRAEINPQMASGQFTGMLYLDRESAHFVNKALLASSGAEGTATITDHSSLSDLLNYIADKKSFDIHSIDVSGNWAELDTLEDVSRFIFGTKAETLERIKPILKNSVVCDQFHFNVEAWNREKPQILTKIQRQFRGNPIIVRSSSKEEDSWESSQAGAFLSIADVDPANRNELHEAIQQVVKAFTEKGADGGNLHNQVLIQPFIKNVEMSGVVFTQSLETGAPYYTINYDDVSGKTDTVTSGINNEHKTVKVFEQVERNRIQDVRIRSLIDATEELVNLLGYKALDIEFILTKKKELYVVQVRPITIKIDRESKEAFQNRLLTQVRLLESRFKPKFNLHGKTTVLADMTDWNPAEMIGTRPKPLSFSLYEYLITNSTWRNARAKMGYNNPLFERLMVIIGGHPYIDVRNSFNNLIPSGLHPVFCDRLIDYYLQKLTDHPVLHDKVEFDIVVTCFAPDINKRLQELSASGFSEGDLSAFRKALKTLTQNAVTEKINVIDELIEQTESIQERISKLLKTNPDSGELPGAIYYLLEDCIKHGTIPFSILARNGFIASSFLRGFVDNNVITEAEKDSILKGIETVAGDLVQDMSKVKRGSMPISAFLNRYGHLRPGSYDITSLSYEEAPAYYFTVEDISIEETEKEWGKHENRYTFDNYKKVLSEESLQKIDLALKDLELDFDAHLLLEFIEKSTWAREYAKFNFSKSLHQVLKFVKLLGQSNGLSKEQMSYLTITDIVNLGFRGESGSWREYLTKKAKEGETWYKQVNSLETPGVITSIDNLYIVEEFESKANYVTSQTVSGEIFVLSANSDPSEMDGKIVAIEGADPGFDWIFMHPITGLITKYGGAASHMTIRCAEFGLPAAIGCGPDQYENVVKSKKVELNCQNKNIIVLA